MNRLMSSCSCITNQNSDDWFSNIDSKKVNLNVLLDLKKAYGTVEHKILLHMLEA